MTQGTAAARMAGSSIVAPTGVAWATHFLNAAFYSRPREERTVDDLRLAHGILSTLWAQRGRRLGVRDRAKLQRAFGKHGPLAFGKLDAEQLRTGAAQLLGDWFPAAWDDSARRAYGIAFPSVEERRAFDPAARLRRGSMRTLAPPRRPPERQTWATYPPVPLPDPEAALALLQDPPRWPDFSSAAGRFTPVRRGGLEDQTFEIHLALQPGAHALFATRGYVTCTALELGGAGLQQAVSALGEHVEAAPAGARPLAFIELTTHKGHFMGRGISRLVVYDDGGEASVRDVGSWDQMSPLLAAGYKAGGHEAQLLFWGPDDPESGMLAQLALVSAGERR